MSSTQPGSTVRQRFKDSWRLFLFIAWGVGNSVVALVTFAVSLVVAALSIIGVGVLLLPWFMRVVRGVANLEIRRLRAAGYQVEVPFDSEPESTGGVSWATSVRVLTDPATRRTLGWLLCHSTLGLFTGVVGIALPVTALSDATLPLYWWVIPEGGPTAAFVIPVHSWSLALFFAVLSPVWVLLFVYLAPWLSRLQAWHSRLLLTPHSSVDLSRRVSELTATRAAALKAHTSELRRIERALHDGSQNRLVAVAVLTGAARRAVERDPSGAADAMEAAHQASEEALAELRSVVRSILPPVLSDRGLNGALLSLVSHSVVPCRADIADLPRVASSVEACAYFVVSELLANTAKHSGASDVEVRARVEGDWLLLRVWDNGSGGASRNGGTGLSGIADRVAAFDGHLNLSSPVGGPTVVDVELPCG